MWTIELVAVIGSVCTLSACSQSTPPANAPKTQLIASTSAAKPFTVASIFPPGSGRDMVLSTCGSCHSVLCAARGQRTKQSWDSVKKDHADKLTGGSPGELNVMFDYLEENFNDMKPEPQIPAELLQQGCTPF